MSERELSEWKIVWHPHTFLMQHGRARGEQVAEQPPLQPEVVRGVGSPLHHPLDAPVW